MKNKISEKSRRHSQEALYALSEIKQKLPFVQDYDSMSENDFLFLKDRIERAGNGIAGTNYRHFNFCDAVKESRNILAHQTKPEKDNINHALELLYKNLDNSIRELEQNVHKINSQDKDLLGFEFAGTSLPTEQKRKSFVDSIKSFFNRENFVPKTEDPVEKEFMKTSEKVFNPTTVSEKNLIEYAQGQEGLEDSIAKDIIEFTENTHRVLQETDPFIAEENFIKKTSSINPNDLQKKFHFLSAQYQELESVKIFPSGVNLKFYEKEFLSNDLKKKNTIDSIAAVSKQNEILFRNFMQDLTQQLETRKTKWQLEQIEILRNKFIKELYDKIQQYKKLQERLKDFTKDFGRLWDLAKQNFSDNGFEVLKEFGDLLENDKGLQELAQMIGRHYSEEKKFRRELREKIVTSQRFNPEPAYKGQISGIGYSGNITDALPGELSLYCNPGTNLLFKKKFASSELLSYIYSRNTAYLESHRETEEVLVGEDDDKKGPMLICVDTSGSMQGTPEKVAKTIAYALAKKSLEEKRKCYLISFSTGIETMDLSTFSGPKGFENLISFLRMSFNGGTDANPALTHAVKMLETNNWKNADLLMISDFCMGNLNDTLTEKINMLKENKTRFFSLAVTRDSGSNNQVIECFNKNWIYDKDSPGAQENLVRQLYEMKEA